MTKLLPPLKSRMSRSKSRLSSRYQSRSKPLSQPTEKPKNQQPEPSLSPLIPGPEAARIPSENPDLPLGYGTIEREKENFDDLIKEAKELQTGDPADMAPDGPGPALDRSLKQSEPAAIAVKPAFADTLTDLWAKSLRLGVKYATKGDLLPPTPEQHKRISACLAGLAEKHLPAALLSMQDELSLVGVTAEYIMSNIQPAPKEPVNPAEPAAC